MNFDTKTFLYSIDKELIIKTSKAFLKKNIKELRNICTIKETKTEDEIIYNVNNIKDYNKFLYIISVEINRIIVETYFKSKLKEHFDNYKEIYKNHQNFSFENNYVEFLIKSKLFLFFKFNEELNIPAFLLFNCKKAYEEFDAIVEAEVEAGGCLYEDMEEEREQIESIANRYNTLFKYMSGKSLKNEVEDIHVFQEGKNLKIVNEKGTLLNTGQTGVDFNDLKQYYLENCSKDAPDIEVLGFYLGLIIALGAPERIIVYNSINNDFKEQIFKDLGVLKQVLSLETECYVSEENKPRK